MIDLELDLRVASAFLFESVPSQDRYVTVLVDDIVPAHIRLDRVKSARHQPRERTELAHPHFAIAFNFSHHQLP